MVPSRDPKASAEATTDLLTDGGEAEETGRSGARYTRKSTWEASVKRHLEVYNRLVG
ncbi:hypothetical protein KEJ44_05110 [Candidatus Bathyarchaeota archaeon]|nr:hypothetical protein [Candidatus Bathyarchaeota archaeon]